MKSFFGPIPNDLLPIAALMASLAVAAFLATVAGTPIHLKSVGALSTELHIIYVACTTIVATILTAFIASQVRGLLLRQIDGELLSTSNFKSLNRRWRVILKIGGLADSARYPEAAIFYLLTGLITTAIVVGLTPDLTTHSLPYNPKISYGPNNCYDTQPLPLVEQEGRPYYWDLGNGSAFFIPANRGGCPTRYATVLAGNVNSVNPNAFAYADGGVEVLDTAIILTPFWTCTGETLSLQLNVFQSCERTLSLAGVAALLP